jgi:GMP synthase-like glutamine amidotransferase
LPDEFTAFQWHEDTFSVLPPGAIPLAESPACKNQGFTLGGKIWAFQFHWEMTAAIAGYLAKEFHYELSPGPWVQSAEEIAGRPDTAKEDAGFIAEFLSRLEKSGC